MQHGHEERAAREADGGGKQKQNRDVLCELRWLQIVHAKSLGTVRRKFNDENWAAPLNAEINAII